MLTPRSVAGLVDGTLDLAFLRPPVGQRGLIVQVLRREPLVAVLPEQHPLARLEAVPLVDLADEQFVAYPSAHRSVVHDAFMDACQRAGFEPRVAHEVGETSTLVAFVAAGLGVALVPASVRHLQITSAVYRPLAGPSADVVLALAHRADDSSPVLRRVLGRVRELLGKTGREHDPIALCT